MTPARAAGRSAGSMLQCQRRPLRQARNQAKKSAVGASPEPGVRCFVALPPQSPAQADGMHSRSLKRWLVSSSLVLGLLNGLCVAPNLALAQAPSADGDGLKRAREQFAQ